MDPIAVENFSNLQLDIKSLPRYEEVDLQPISRKYLVKMQIGTAISLVFFAVGLMTAFYFAPPEIHFYLWLGVIFLALVFGWSFFNNIMYVRRSGYALREKDIIYRRGFLFQRTTVVPFNRIQHVTVERSFLDKILKISTVKVFTAGGSGSDINVPGIYPNTATSLKEEISARIYSHA
jgi:membrane protein YdbS with pleckstrin-like domain